MRKRVLGEEHPDTLSSMGNLAVVYYEDGRYVDAEALILEALEIEKRILGEEHPDTLTSLGNLAVLYEATGRNADAEPLYLEVLQVRTRVQGTEHPDTLKSMHDLARELSIPWGTLNGWRRKGWLVGRQAQGLQRPCWIAWADDEELARLQRLRDYRPGNKPYPTELTTPRIRSMN